MRRNDWAARRGRFAVAFRSMKFRPCGLAGGHGASARMIWLKQSATWEAIMVEIEIIARPGLTCLKLHIGRSFLLFMLSFASLSRFHL